MGSRFLQSEPGLLIEKIASLVPKAASVVSRFAGDVARAFARYVMPVTVRDGKGDQTGTGDAEIPPDLPTTGDGRDRDDGVFDAADFESMFLAPTLAPRPRPRPRVLRRRRLRKLTDRFMAAIRRGTVPAAASSNDAEAKVRAASADAARKAVERQSQFMRKPPQPPPGQRNDHRARRDFNHPKPPWMR